MIARPVAVAIVLAVSVTMVAAGDGASFARAIETAACRDWALYSLAHVARAAASGAIDVDTERALLDDITALNQRCIGPEHRSILRRYRMIEALLDDLAATED